MDNRRFVFSHLTTFGDAVYRVYDAITGITTYEIGE